jgi:hypothetical protein
MKKTHKVAGLVATGILALGTIGTRQAAAQDPILTPILVDTATSIIVSAVTPKPKVTGLTKFEGFVMHANNTQITARAKNNDLTIQTFTLTGDAATKMQALIDKGGYQYGDKITIFYDHQSMQAVKFKGKPSKAL